MSVKQISIRGSVGLRGQNRGEDVRKIQKRLNDLMPPRRLRIKVNGLVGGTTKEAIREFQAIVVGYQWPDKRVDTNDRTLRALNDSKSRRIWARDANARAAIEFDKQLFSYALRLVRSQGAIGNRNKERSEQIAAVEREIKQLESTVARAYPDGRPTGAGLFALVTPGAATDAGFVHLNSAFEWGKGTFGVPGEICGALLMAPASAIVVAWGGLIDFGATTVELGAGDSKHHSPEDYDRKTRQLKDLRKALVQAQGE